MKPVAFDLIRCTDAAAAAKALAAGDGATKAMGGGQSLGPMLNLRLARPEALVDVTALPGLEGVIFTIAWS